MPMAIPVANTAVMTTDRVFVPNPRLMVASFRAPWSRIKPGPRSGTCRSFASNGQTENSAASYPV